MTAVLIWVGLSWIGLSLNWPLSEELKLLLVPTVCAVLVTPFVILANVRFRRKARQVDARVEQITNRFNNATVLVSWQEGKGKFNAAPGRYKEGETVRVWASGSRVSEKLPGMMEHFRIFGLWGILLVLGALGYLARRRG